MEMLSSELCDVELLKPYSGNARTHSTNQIDQLTRSIETFGFTNPVLVSDKLEIVAGHGRVMAAKKLGLNQVPIIKLSHLNDEQRRAYVLADNKLAENAGWDEELLRVELQVLEELEFDLDVIGFSTAELDILFDVDDESGQAEDINNIPNVDATRTVTLIGDLWQLDQHRLICGDATSAQTIFKLCSNGLQERETVDLMFTDPPYNVPIGGHVSGLGKFQHREFIQGCGELSSEQFEAFLTDAFGHAAAVLRDGAIAYVCMDWRHMEECLRAGRATFDELKNLCVWNKTNAGMGSFYRSKHELVFVFKKGRKPHTNNFLLGEHGRHRTNVWDYAGMTSLTSQRDDQLAMHPTVKPVAMIADAIRDCSNRGDLVLDPFAGSGSTLMAAEETGRRARLVELDPAYCDVIIRRFQNATGKTAKLLGNDQTFTQVEKERQPDQSS